MAIRFHLDENVDPAVAHGLTLRGVDVTVAADAGLLGRDDVDHLDFARTNQRILVTQDEDFLAMHAAGVPHAGIAYCHQHSRSIGEMIRSLLLIHQCLSAEEMVGQVEFL